MFMNNHDLQNVVIDQILEPGTRVTVAMGTNRHLDGTSLSKEIL